jgi:hypothetical protein
MTILPRFPGGSTESAAAPHCVVAVGWILLRRSFAIPNSGYFWSS